MSAAWAYIRNFVSSPSFQEKQPWVIGITKLLSVIPAHYWTGSRFFGSLAVCLLFYFGYSYLSMAVFLLFALTDWVDGKVARFRGEQGGFGATLDGVADKIFVLPIIIYWGYKLSPYLFLLIVPLCLVESCGYGIVYFVKRRKKEKKDIYEHNMAGKYKFACQIILVCILWTISILGYENSWAAVIFVSAALGGVIVLAALSVAGKIDSRWAI